MCELDERNGEEYKSKILPPCGRQNDRGEAVVRMTEGIRLGDRLNPTMGSTGFVGFR
jgi:hypothetical protein